MRISCKSWKTKLAGILLSATVVLATLPASTILFTVGAVVITPTVATGAIGALMAFWGISDKGDKIISALKDKNNNRG